MNHFISRLARRPGHSIHRLLPRFVFWGAAVVVGLAAILFAQTSTLACSFYAWMIAGRPWLALLITPALFAAVVWLTRRVFAGTEGSGIPQAMAALKIPELSGRRSVLSPRVAVGKILLTSLALCGGASVGREGPTVQIGASIMHSLGRLIRLPSQDMERSLILAGGAAGISAAFNTPLAGIVFAIEELSRSFEKRASGTVLTAVIIAGFTSMAILGNYSYFGTTDVILSLRQAIWPVILCGIVGGITGGLFARVLIAFSRGLPGRAGRWINDHPVSFACVCGIGLALLGLASGSTIYGTGYEEAKSLLESSGRLPAGFAPLKLAATVLSYVSGLPGGIFAPSLAAGAGVGSLLSSLASSTPLQAMAILGMAGHFTGVVRAPITAVVIVIEMTSDHSLTLPLLAVALIAFAVSKLVCPQPLYRTMAQSFLEKSVRRRTREASPAPGQAA